MKPTAKPTDEELREAVPGSPEYFWQLRMNPAHHIGCGDIRLTLAQQEEILASLEAARADTRRMDTLLEILGPDFTFSPDGNRSFCTSDFADLDKWDDDGGGDDSPELRRAFRAAIDRAATSAEGEAK